MKTHELIFQDNPIRARQDGDDLWFVAADICEALGYASSAESACRCLDADERDAETFRTPSGDQQMLIISEPGLYKLVARSNKPLAKQFDRWVRHDVLPTIRKHGCYPAPSLTTQQHAVVELGDNTIQRLTDSMRPVVREEIYDAISPIDARLRQVELNQEKRKPLTKVTIKNHLYVCQEMLGGFCPCCKDTVIVDNYSKIERICEFDHFYGRSQNKAKETWPVCERCNDRLRTSDFKDKASSNFAAYQSLYETWEIRFDRRLLLGQ